MKIVNLTCPGCGARLEVDMDRKMAFCSYCGAALPIDDEIQKVQLDGAEKAGYEFEKGRQRAQAEAAQASFPSRQAFYQPASQPTFQPQVPPQPQQAPREPSKRRKTWLWVLGWILHFPRSAHDYHAEQGRHEQKGQVRHHCRRLDSLSAHRAWRRWVEVSVGWLPSALEPLFRRGSTFAWTDCSRTRKLQVPVHSMTASSLMMYPLELHFVLDGETFPEKRSPALVCWSRIARERTAIQSVFPLERDGV